MAIDIQGLSELTAGVRGASKKDELGQEDFLRLMVSQLQNQNPLKPLENTEFLGQLAQFSVVSGIQNMQTSFGQLADSLQANQALQGSSLLGHRALVPSAVVALEGSSSARAAVDLPQASAAVTVEIQNLAGQTVRSLPLGPQTSGRIPLEWDGLDQNGQRAPAGLYSLQVRAEQNNRDVALDTLTAARIESVSLGGTSGLVLNLAGLGAVPLSQVREIQSGAVP